MSGSLYGRALRTDPETGMAAEDWQPLRQGLTNWVNAERQKSYDMGLADPSTGLPTRAGVAALGPAYANSLLMGTTAPSGAPSAALLRGPVKSEPGYVYHATNTDNLANIAAEGRLRTHEPHEFTDQDVWPDGKVEPRNYFTPTAENTWQFAPEEGPSVLLRMRSDAHPTRAERSTGDLYSTKPVDAKHLEYMTDDGGWHPASAYGAGSE